MAPTSPSGITGTAHIRAEQFHQDLEDALGNAGREDPGFLRARIAVWEEALRRFPDEDDLMVENRRRAVAKSYFELGETDKAERLFEQSLAADPCWGGVDRLGRPLLLREQSDEGLRPRRGAAPPRLLDSQR